MVESVCVLFITVSVSFLLLIQFILDPYLLAKATFRYPIECFVHLQPHNYTAHAVENRLSPPPHTTYQFNIASHRTAPHRTALRCITSHSFLHRLHLSFYSKRRERRQQLVSSRGPGSSKSPLHSRQPSHLGFPKQPIGNLLLARATKRPRASSHE